MTRKNAFKRKKKKPRLKFNPRLALIGLQTTGSWDIMHCAHQLAMLRVFVVMRVDWYWVEGREG